MPDDTHITEAEHEIFQRELDSFVPEVVLDAHAHLWSSSISGPNLSDAFTPFEDETTIEVWHRRMDELFPGRRQGGLVIPGVLKGGLDSLERQNEFVSREALSDPLCRPSMFVTPQMDAAYVRQEVKRLNVAGLKCYHYASTRQPSWDSDIPEFLPEEHMQVANEEGLCITLHMVKSRAVADPSNQHWIRTYCERYPNMKLILAHAARSFNPVHAMEGLEKLRGLPNLWCDMAAVTEVGACEAIIETLGHDRLLWGSDYPVSHIRSRCVSIGDTFTWIYPADFAGEEHGNDIASAFIFNGLESLRVLKQAVWHRRLSDSQVEDIFFRNLADMLGIDP